MTSEPAPHVPPHAPLGVEPNRARRMVVLDTSMQVLYPSILVLGIYFLFAGHNRPGGGFVGGLVIGAAISLRYVARGVGAVHASFRLPPHVILGVGLLISATTALVPLLLGGSVLEHGDKEFDLPLFHHVKVTSALPFDIGVALVVIGLVVMAFEAFGDEQALDDPASAGGPVDEPPEGER
ncbi:MAG: MnhB domain-containing protein [Ilumatobacteraceae bacterium]